MTDPSRGSRWLLAAIISLLLTACKRPPLPPHPSDQTPKTRATVVTIRTMVQPSNQTLTHTIVIAGGKARSSGDVDRWRLFDFAEKRVTFVDEIGKTSRTELFASILARHRKAMAIPLPEGSPHAQFVATGARRTIAGVAASEWVMRVGAYERHLWVGRHPSIPDDLFALLQSSSPAASPLFGLNRPLEEAVLKTPGFPMADHAELPYGKAKLVVDKVVLSVEQRDVPQSWFDVPPADRAAPLPTAAVPQAAIRERR